MAIGILDRIRGKKKEPEENIQVTTTTNIITKHKGKVVKETNIESQQPPIIKPDVYEDKDELESALRSRNGHKKFSEKKPRSGIQTKTNEQYDRNKINALLAMDVDDSKRQTFTVTPKERFLLMVVGDTLDEVAAEGDNREESVWLKFSRHHDLRAPSTYPEPGDNRNALIKAEEIMSQSEDDRNFMKMGGG